MHERFRRIQTAVEVAVALVVVTSPLGAVDLNLAVREAVFMLADYLEPLVPDLQLASGIVPVAGISFAAITRILMNLTRNARKAMRGRSPEDSRLVIGTELCGERPNFWVSDNGCGMCHDQLAQLQQPIGDHNGEHGHGLLSVRALVREIGGLITVQSSPETGTTFRIVLPPALAR